MYGCELNYKEGWTQKNWCFWIVVLEETLESPLDCKEIQPVHTKGSRSWVFIGRTDVKTETPVFWPPDMNTWLTGKDPDALKMGGEGENRGWDDWMASLTQWTWVWVNSGSWWWTGRPGVLQFTGLQRVGHDWVNELNWTELDSKESKPVNPKGNQPWIFNGRTDAETEAPILWPLDVKSRLIGKDPDAGKDWGQEEKGMTEHKMVW